MPRIVPNSTRSIDDISPGSGVVIVGNGTIFVGQSGATFRTTIGLGATNNVSFLGANFGFVASATPAPNQTARIRQFWFERRADLNQGWMFDYQDEFAYRTLRGATTSVSPAASSGTVAQTLVDDSNSLVYNSGTSPSPIEIVIDCSANPILAANSGSYAVGLTFRSSAASANPTNIKIEYRGTGSGYSTVFDGAVNLTAETFSTWVGPNALSPSASFDITHVRITLTVPTPLPSTFRLQRIILYHATAEWDPWHLRINGGTLLGNLTLADAVNIAVNTTTGTKIGTATGQKLGFWNATPVIQPAGAAQAALTNSSGGTADGTIEAVGATNTSDVSAAINNNFTELHTLLNAIRTALVNTGIIKGAA